MYGHGHAIPDIIIAPDFGQQLFPCKGKAAILCQKFEQFVFFQSQGNRLTAGLHRMLAIVDNNASDADQLFLTFARTAPQP